jgi:hypothetical protein
MSALLAVQNELVNFCLLFDLWSICSPWEYYWRLALVWLRFNDYGRSLYPSQHRLHLLIAHHTSQKAQSALCLRVPLQEISWI